MGNGDLDVLQSFNSNTGSIQTQTLIFRILLLRALPWCPNQLDPETGDLKDRKAEDLAEMLAVQKQPTVSWQELATNSEKIRKRKIGKGYSAGWWPFPSTSGPVA